MLSLADLKQWLARDLQVATKLLLILNNQEGPRSVKALLSEGAACGFRLKPSANPSMMLSRLGPLAIRTAEGWEITPAGRQHLLDMGIETAHQAAHAAASDLRAHLEQVSDTDTQAFLEEAIGCLEAGFYRAAVILSWLAAIHVLQRDVVKHHLAAFNSEAKRVDSRWRNAVNEDDLGRMKESDFLDRLSSLSMIGRNVKEQLKGRLDLRNACGHPNSLRISRNTAASHVEILLMNVFEKFS